MWFSLVLTNTKNIMKNLLLGFLAISLMSLTSDGLKDKWISYTSEEAKFSVKFPGEFDEQITEKEGRTTYKAISNLEGITFIVSATRHKTEVENNQELLEVSLSEFNVGLKGTIVSQEQANTNGIVGLKASIVITESNALLDYEVYMKGNFQYQVMVYSATEVFDKELSNQFFKGFKFLK